MNQSGTKDGEIVSIEVKGSEQILGICFKMTVTKIIAVSCLWDGSNGERMEVGEERWNQKMTTYTEVQHCFFLFSGLSPPTHPQPLTNR